MLENALSTAKILLPAAGVDPEKWAVIACDQFTSQPKYWQEAEAIVGDSPSTLRVTLPEIWLSERKERLGGIIAAMKNYLSDGTLTEAADGFVLTERTTSGGIRIGLVAAVDLDKYDPAKGSHSLIRATEGTVASRVPPRAEIRADAPIELPHVMMLIDDPACSVIEAMYARRDSLRKLYDLELMLGGGHLRGWAVEGDDVKDVFAAIAKLAENADGLLYAVGDGNHSLAAAKKCRVDKAASMTEEEKAVAPSRFALVELVNLHSPALVFEPIHRVLFGTTREKLTDAWRAWMQEKGVTCQSGDDVRFFDASGEDGFGYDSYALPMLQPFLDSYLEANPGVEIDYIHGETDLHEIVSERRDTVGILLKAFNKNELFPSIRRYGVLPRKSFSIGEANDKRYYMEARRI